MSRKRSRAFKFNVTTFDENTEAWLQNHDCRYLVYGYELAPSTGRPHFEGAVYYSNPRDLEATRKVFHAKAGPGYFDVALGNSIQNYNYSTKDGNFFEKGVRPLTDSEKGEKEAQRFKRARECAIQGDFASIPDDLYVRYQSSFKRMHREDGPVVTDLQGEGELKVGLWIWGLPRTGKSRLAREKFSNLYLKGLNKWWCGYHNHDYVLIEDFGPIHAKELTDYLKRWSDRYAFSGETKGGTITLRPKRIIITSNYDMKECFGGVDLQALLARFEIIHIV